MEHVYIYLFIYIMYFENKPQNDKFNCLIRSGNRLTAQVL